MLVISDRCVRGLLLGLLLEVIVAASWQVIGG
jgi:hypothetical protein